MNLRNLEQKELSEQDKVINSYKNLIDFFSTERDYKKLCIMFAKNYPVEFNDMVNDEDFLIETTIWENRKEELDEICNNIRSKRYIDAIKCIRSLFDIGLRQAKDVSDWCANKYKQSGSIEGIDIIRNYEQSEKVRLQNENRE